MIPNDPQIDTFRAASVPGRQMNTTRIVNADDPPAIIRRKVSAWLDSTLPDWWPNGNRREVELQWRDDFHRAGLATPGWPTRYGGLGLDPVGVRAVNTALVAHQAPVPYNLVTVHMIGAVLNELGNEEQRERFMPGLASRTEVWCQLFSEPGAGSDLASLACRAEPQGDIWIVNGQKIWSSFASEAKRGLLLARTDPSAPKQAGITAFAIDMETPGISVLPIRQMTGDSQFCEVFFDDVEIPGADRIGEPNRGWAVAGVILTAERNMLGGQGSSPVARVGGIDVDELVRRSTEVTPTLRDRILDHLVRDRVISLLGARLQADPQHASLVKLAQAEHNQSMQALAMNLVGPSTIAHAVDDETASSLAWGFLRSRANTIGGGTSEVMRNIIGERILGLPREPDPYRGAPWSKVPSS